MALRCWRVVGRLVWLKLGGLFLGFILTAGGLTGVVGNRVGLTGRRARGGGSIVAAHSEEGRRRGKEKGGRGERENLVQSSS